MLQFRALSDQFCGTHKHHHNVRNVFDEMLVVSHDILGIALSVCCQLGIVTHLKANSEHYAQSVMEDYKYFVEYMGR